MQKKDKMPLWTFQEPENPHWASSKWFYLEQGKGGTDRIYIRLTNGEGCIFHTYAMVTSASDKWGINAD